MEKAEHIKQLKKLIKKYHPDLCEDENLESIYNEITVKLNNVLNRLKAEENIQNIIQENNENTKLTKTKNALARIEDQSYVYYKLGIKYYKNIHPGQFYKRNTDKTYETKTYEEQLEIINKIYISFNLSEYYFNTVVDEYPKSQWAEDAKEKIALLKKLYKSYENIDVEENNQIINTEKFVNEMGLKTMF
jgi:outer membrane protein assembly factor BamD (BamD/ComL family)